MKYAGIPYKAFGENGEFIRDARTIGELPNAICIEALAEATHGIANIIGRAPFDLVHFGTPAFHAFGMNDSEAKRHPYADLLLKLGCDIPLSFCG